MNSYYNNSNWNCNSSVSSSSAAEENSAYLDTNKRYRVPTLSPYDALESYFSSSASPTPQPSHNMLTTPSGFWPSTSATTLQQQDDSLSACSSSITNTPEMGSQQAFNYITAAANSTVAGGIMVDPTIYVQNASALVNNASNQVMFPQMMPLLPQQQPETHQQEQLFDQKFMSHIYQQQQQAILAQQTLATDNMSSSSYTYHHATAPNYYPSPIMNLSYAAAPTTTTTNYSGFYNTSTSLPSNNSSIRSTSATPSVTYTNYNSNNNTSNYSNNCYSQPMSFNHNTTHYTPSPSPQPQPQHHHVKYEEKQQQKEEAEKEDFNATTTNNKATRKHQEINNGSKSIFPCTSCDKLFSRPYNLKSHMRTHTLERPYECPYKPCGWKFARPHDLRRHELGHTGEKPHGCQFCHKQFARCDALKRHWKVDSNCAHALAMNGGKEAMMLKRKQQKKKNLLLQQKMKKAVATNNSRV